MLDRFYVYVEGEGWIQWNEDIMEFLDISEDLMGCDVYTFKYKNKTYKSRMTTNR